MKKTHLIIGGVVITGVAYIIMKTKANSQSYSTPVNSNPIIGGLNNIYPFGK